MRPSALRNTFVAALVATVAVGSLSPALAKPGKRQGPKKKPAPVAKKYGHHKPADIPREYAPVQCTGDPASIQILDIPMGSQIATGYFAMPSTPPKGIVVFAHGYGHVASEWQKHLTDVASRDGVVAVAMNYRPRLDSRGNPIPVAQGWWVQEGAVDSIRAAQAFEGPNTCPTAKTVVMFGVSMGGNTSGLAVAAQAKKINGSPLFDYWFDLEGATTVMETYLEAKALAGAGNAFAQGAVKDIEAEMGGPLGPDTKDAYLNATVLNRADDIKKSNKDLGVVMVQAVDDGLVGYNQSPEMYTRLRALGLKTDFWTVLTHGPGSEAGTTLDGYAGLGVDLGFAGHASELSDTHLVMAMGFNRLDALFLKKEAPACRTGILDGTSGHAVANPIALPTSC